MHTFKKGDYVVWRWSTSIGHGTVEDVRHERTTIESKGKSIVRVGTEANPAILIKDHNGTPVLKRASELEKAK